VGEDFATDPGDWCFGVEGFSEGFFASLLAFFELRAFNFETESELPDRFSCFFLEASSSSTRDFRGGVSESELSSLSSLSSLP